MKILRLFDSLKFLRTIFVAVAVAFTVVPAYAESQDSELQDSELPVGYRRLQDITTNGNVRYVSDMYLTGADTLKFSFHSRAGNLLGCYSGQKADNNYSFYASTSTTGEYARYNGQTGGSSISAGNRYNVTMSPTGVTGTRNPSSFTPSEFTCSVNFTIFATSPTGEMHNNATIIGSIEVSGNNNRKFIPVERVSDGEIGYFDTMKNVFLQNQGSGTPITSGYDDSHIISTKPTSSTLPDGYTELEYIEGTGTQWIDTGIKITGNDIIETEFKNTSSTGNGGLYGVFALGDSSAFYANGTYYGYDVKNKKVDTNVSVDTAWHNVIHNFVDGTLKLDDTTVEFAPFSFENNVNSHLFTRYYNGTYGYYFSGYVKKHKITRNGVVIINLIPARRDRDGVVGMYDLADSNPETAFHTNAGTGEFVAGPDM